MTIADHSPPSNSGRRLASNVLWNLLGLLGPMLVAIWAIPILIEQMGAERFGLMSIVWLMVGYFSLFDLGIGRALTKLVAERFGTDKAFEIPSLVGAGMRLMWWLGLAGGGVVALLAPWLAEHVIKMADSLRSEALWSLWILAATVPFVIASAGNIGVLQGMHKFMPITIIRLPLGIANYAGPVLIMGFTRSLVVVTAFVAVTRVITWLALKLLADREVRRITANKTEGDAQPLQELLAFGGWVTVSNIVGPVMVYFDRFLISAVLGAAAVAYYTTPFEVISKLSILPSAILAVLFPALAAHLMQAPERATRLYGSAAGLLITVMALPVGLIMLFAPEMLRIWLGQEFATQSSAVARWLVLGIYVNSVAGLPFIAVQGQGRPDLTAKLHLAELMVFIPLLYWSLHVYGIAGAAASWALRVLVDFIALSWLCARVSPGLRSSSLRAVVIVPAVAGAVGALAIPSSLNVKLVFACLLIVGVLVLALLEVRRAGIHMSFRKVFA